MGKGMFGLLVVASLQWLSNAELDLAAMELPEAKNLGFIGPPQAAVSRRRAPWHLAFALPTKW